jgi:GT2 family glycosyltransferase
MDYKEKYEEELERNNLLSERLAELSAEKEEAEYKLNRIKSNPLWKASAPARRFVNKSVNAYRKVKGIGGVRGLKAKLAYKKREKLAKENYGTKSFPDEDRRKFEESYEFEKRPLISILVPLYNTDETMLREMIGSVKWQTYSNWELCLADGSDDAHAYVKDVVASFNDERIKYKKLEKNGGISENTNQCLTLATGEYIGLFDHDDILHPSALFEYVKVINEQDADYIYCDETTFKSGNINHMLTMHFKPDYAIDNLRANNYICHFSVFKRKLLDSTELFRTKFDGSQDHDMILRLTDKAERIVHVPKLLYYWRCHPASVASNISAKTYAIDAAKGAVADHLRKHGYTDFRITGTKAFETIFKIRYKINGTPLITIVIPNKDHASDLKRCVTSILEKSTYTNYEIIIVENNSTDKKTFDLYEELKETSEKIKVVEFKGEFNYSEVNNFGVSFAKGEYILLLNNDTEVISVNWLEEMLMYAQREDVGAVGAKLYYGDKTIQHAGVVIGLGAHRTAGHTHYKMPKDNLGYMGRLCYAQDVSAVTGACLLVKKSLWDKVGGLDTDFKISLNDVDFCLKLRKEGYLNVFTPFAELYHYESISRGLDDQGEKAERYNKESEHFRNKWKSELEKGDPYYNPNFSLDRSDFSVRI